MGIRALCAAAVVVVCVGQVEAATTVNYDFWLRYEGTDLGDLIFFDPGDEWAVELGDYRADKSKLFKPSLFADLLIGDAVRFVATVIYPDNPDDWGHLYDNGGSAPVCSLGPVSCTDTTFTKVNADGSIFLTYGYSDVALMGFPSVGGTLRYESLDIHLPGTTARLIRSLTTGNTTTNTGMNTLTSRS